MATKQVEKTLTEEQNDIRRTKKRAQNARARAGKGVTSSSWLTSRLEDRELRQEMAEFEAETKRRENEDKKAQLRLKSAFAALALARASLPMPTQIMLELTLWYWAVLWDEDCELREDVRDKNGQHVLDAKTGKPVFRLIKRRFDAAASQAGSVLEDAFGLDWTEKHLDEIARGERIAKAILAREHEQRSLARVAAKKTAAEPTKTS